MGPLVRHMLVAAVLLLGAAASQAQLVGDVGTALLVGNQIAQLFKADSDGKMIISAAGDGSQCLDAGDWPADCAVWSVTNPYCQSTGLLVYPTCTNAAWTFFKYNGMLSFSTGMRRLGRSYCLQAWACAAAETAECQIRGAPCDWGGSQYQAFFTGDPLQRKKNSFTLFRIHFANKGETWCLTNVKTGSQAQLKPCDGSLEQLWFVPEW